LIDSSLPIESSFFETTTVGFYTGKSEGYLPDNSEALISFSLPTTYTKSTPSDARLLFEFGEDQQCAQKPSDREAEENDDTFNSGNEIDGVYAKCFFLFILYFSPLLNRLLKICHLAPLLVIKRFFSLVFILCCIFILFSLLSSRSRLVVTTCLI